MCEGLNYFQGPLQRIQKLLIMMEDAIYVYIYSLILSVCIYIYAVIHSHDLLALYDLSYNIHHFCLER